MRNTTFEVVKAFVHGVAGSVIGAVSYPVGTLPLNRHLPKAVVDAYRTVYRTNVIGPNLKGVAYVTIPVAGAVVPPLLVTSSALYGFIRSAIAGAFSDSEKTFFSRVFGTVKDELQTVDQKLIEDLLPQLHDYQPQPLPEGKQPFDISPFRALKGVVCGVAFTLLEAPALFLITLLRVPKIVYSFMTHMFKEAQSFEEFVMLCLMLFLVTGALVLLPPVVMLGSICFGLGVTCARTYSKGIKHAMSRMFNDIKSWNKILVDVGNSK